MSVLIITMSHLVIITIQAQDYIMIQIHNIIITVKPNSSFIGMPNHSLISQLR